MAKKNKKNVGRRRPDRSARGQTNSQALLELHDLPGREGWLTTVLLFVAIFALYALTAPRLLALEDDGEFITAIYHFGVAHPPGYPLLTLVGQPFMWLPFESVAYKAHLISAFFGALGCSLVYVFVRLLTGRTTAGISAALLLACSSIYWSQSIITEAYTLNAALFAAILICALKYLERARQSWLCATALLFGAGLSNHWPLLVAATPGLAVMLWPRIAELLRGTAKALPFFLIGLTPYLLMIWRSQVAPEWTFSGAIDSFREFSAFVNREAYSQIQDQIISMTDRLRMLGFLGSEMLFQFTPVGAALAIVGAAVCWKKQRWVAAGLLVTLVCSSLLLFLLLGFNDGFKYRAVAEVYPLTAYLVMAIFIGIGLAAIISWFANKLASRGVHSTASVIGAGATACLTFTLVAMNWGTNYRADYSYAEDFATTMLNSFGKNATVFVAGDVPAFTLWYQHHVQGLRPDIKLMHPGALGFHNGARLFDPGYTTKPQADAAMNSLLNNAKGPVYFFGGQPSNRGYLDWGLYQQLAEQNNSSNTMSMNESILGYYRRIEAQRDHRDAWTLYHRNTVIRNYARWLTLVTYYSQDPSAKARHEPELNAIAGRNFVAALERLSQLVSNDAGIAASELLGQLDQAEGIVRYYDERADIALLNVLRGRILKRIGNIETAMQAFTVAIDQFHNQSNQAIPELLKIYAGTKDCRSYTDLRDRFFSKESLPSQLRKANRRMQQLCEAT